MDIEKTSIEPYNPTVQSETKENLVQFARVPPTNQVK